MTTADAERFEQQRPNLLRLAYRMLGTRGDAEDIVQETYLRWHRSAATPDNLAAWLTRTCVRLCLDRLKSAQRTRETYLGPWLPEPWVDSREDQRAELDETMSMALMVLLQRLNPGQRAALLLHDVFDYSFDEIAKILDLNPVHCRQLASRARKSIKADRVPAPVSHNDYRRIASAFFTALQTGERTPLQKLLADDVVIHSDGGGKALAARRPVHGATKAALFLSRALGSQAGHLVTEARINGAPGLVIRYGQSVVTTLSLHIVDGRVQEIYIVRNPDKLAAVQPAVAGA